jgi:hypothetical protein
MRRRRQNGTGETITSREAVLVEDAALIRIIRLPVLEAVPSRQASYGLTDPFLPVHEGRFRLSELAGKDTRHPHWGFDNLSRIRRRRCRYQVRRPTE